jgi:hypothetical protein
MKIKMHTQFAFWETKGGSIPRKATAMKLGEAGGVIQKEKSVVRT